MFAVKGWAVDASSLKPQTEPFKSSRPSQDHAQNPSRKRKRQQSSHPNEDVGKLWEQHIEGKVPSKHKKESKGQKKKRKLEKGLSNSNKLDVNPQNTDSTQSVRTERLPADKQDKKKREKDQTTNKSSSGAERLASKIAKTDIAGPRPSAVPPAPASAKLTPMQAAMRQKLISARFRHLNETLYTAPSATALELFDQNPEMFDDYHAGFRQQVSIWPENPVDDFISTIRARGSVRPPKFHKDKRGRPAAAPVQNNASSTGDGKALPRTHGTCIIADLGCGDARLAQTLTDSDDTSSLKLQIHSYDLHSPSPLVTKADIAHVPQADGSVDVAIFCLALMGTNWIAFIEEAYRLLHWKGELWVAEIKSRFGRVARTPGRPVEHSVGGRKKQAALKKAQEVKAKEMDEVDEATALRTEVDGVETKQPETDVSAFVDVLRRRGFVLKDGEKSIDSGNKMFVKLEFVKAATPVKGKGVPKEADRPSQPKKKFIEENADDVATDDEAKVLKPCLYKIR